MSPQPEALDIAAIRYEDGMLEGLAGAVDPLDAPEADVWLLALADPGNPPLFVSTRDDGSFGPVPWVANDGITRGQVRVGGRRSEPVDMVVLDGLPTTLREPVRPCATVAIELDWGVVATGAAVRRDVVVDNACAEELTVQAMFTALRFGDRGFTLDEAPPWTIPAGTRLAIPITFTAPGAGPAEDVLTVDLRTAALEFDMRWVTLFASGS